MPDERFRKKNKKNKRLVVKTFRFKSNYLVPGECLYMYKLFREIYLEKKNKKNKRVVAKGLVVLN